MGDAFSGGDMSLLGNAGMVSNNVAVAEKLLEASYEVHKGYVTNVTNAMVPGAKRVGLSEEFKGDFKRMMESGDYKGVEGLKVGLEKKEEGIVLEKELYGMKNNMMQSQFLIRMIGNAYERLEAGITGKGK